MKRLFMAAVALCGAAAHAQQQDSMAGMHDSMQHGSMQHDAPAQAAPAPATGAGAPPVAPMDHDHMNHGAMSPDAMDHGDLGRDTMDHGATNHDGMDHGAMNHDAMDHSHMHRGDTASPDTRAMPMTGMYGPYSMSREASGTSWQPESTGMEGIHAMHGDWMTMLHGYANAVYDHQGGPRGGSAGFSESMLMGMAQREVGSGGTLGLRGMLSLDPLMGKSGYPLLFQTGETAEGRTPLIDRQHPHDLFMELAATYSQKLAEDKSTFVYVGLPGEPALGPPAFMHRSSGMDNPEAPISHHWLDSTHITYGVATLGTVLGRWKIEASAFNGREPDQYRWNIETRGFDSGSARLSFNPTARWSLQVSYGRLASPEQLEPNVSVRRTTASAIYDTQLAGGHWQTTFAWGRNRANPGNATQAWLLESAWRWRDTHTFFARAERVGKDELFTDPDPRHHTVYEVNKLSLGYVYDFAHVQRVRVGVGGVVSAYATPSALDSVYGSHPRSFMAFLRARIE
ncbi:MAG TPA: hypothetical protein VGN52_07175 [Burkholderiales bacterium]